MNRWWIAVGKFVGKWGEVVRGVVGLMFVSGLLWVVSIVILLVERW